MDKQEMWAKHRQLVNSIIELVSDMYSLSYTEASFKNKTEAELQQLKLELEQLFTLAINFK